ncbi:hypothetical protein [Okeania sp. SIO1I7]|uniref:hypothetical protein n=1 Tax=Okeania sp. SIO1I7 TaxID=2607772 RepID=UPI0013FCE7BB|nr:hypothetical protein [Okeania sp. SIO1I7]NET25669.1 hypothetical protein [Okeania sp. SIO1I7]
MRLSGDRETINISGLGDASLKIALSIQISHIFEKFYLNVGIYTRALRRSGASG